MLNCNTLTSIYKKLIEYYPLIIPPAGVNHKYYFPVSADDCMMADKKRLTEIISQSAPFLYSYLSASCGMSLAARTAG